MYGSHDVDVSGSRDIVGRRVFRQYAPFSHNTYVTDWRMQRCSINATISTVG